MMPRLLFAILLASGGPASALEWARLVEEIRIAPLQTEVEVEFTFTNRGRTPVAITDLRTNCDCLEARADRPAYAPGETGRIKALFTVGDRLGLYERSISIVASDSPDTVRLAVRIDVPAVAEIEPRTMDWLRESAREPREATVQVAPELAVDFTEAIATSAEFSASLFPEEAGRRYRLQVVPRSTARPTSAVIRLHGRERSTGRAIVLSAYVHVRERE